MTAVDPGHFSRLRRRVKLYTGGWPAIPRPFVTYENQGPDWHFLAFGISAPYTDSVFTVEVHFRDSWRTGAGR